MLLHTNPTRERGEYLGTHAGVSEDITPARKIRARADTNPTRQRGSAGFSLAGASGWYL